MSDLSFSLFIVFIFHTIYSLYYYFIKFINCIHFSHFVMYPCLCQYFPSQSVQVIGKVVQFPLKKLSGFVKPIFYTMLSKYLSLGTLRNKCITFFHYDTCCLQFPASPTKLNKLSGHSVARLFFISKNVTTMECHVPVLPNFIK